MNFDKFSSITTDGTHEMLCLIDILKNNLPHNHIIFQKTYCDLHKINWVVQHTLNTLQIIQTISNWLTSKSITRLLYIYVQDEDFNTQFINHIKNELQLSYTQVFC